MAQAEYHVSDLPEGALQASAEFYAKHLDAARTAMGEDDLVIALPPAEYNHADWRRALARDLARECTPSRVNVISTADEGQKEALISYLAGAKGITGHYLQSHE
jgi:hypothetical protein